MMVNMMYLQQLMNTWDYQDEFCLTLTLEWILISYFNADGFFFPPLPFLVSTPVHSAKGSMSYFLCWWGTHCFCKGLTIKPGRGKCWAWAADLVSFPPVCVASNVLFVLYRSWIIKHSGWSWTKTAGRRIYFLCRIGLLLFSPEQVTNQNISSLTWLVLCQSW